MDKKVVFNQHEDKEFAELFNSFVGHKPAIEYYRHAQNYGPVVSIFKDFLKDFWRHQVEKTGGEEKLWETITNQKRFWWNQTSPTSSPTNYNKTRWQEIAESLFTLYLFGNQQQFDPSKDSHIAALAKFLGKCQAPGGDKELAKIVTDYFTTL